MTKSYIPEVSTLSYNNYLYIYIILYILYIILYIYIYIYYILVIIIIVSKGEILNKFLDRRLP